MNLRTAFQTNTSARFIIHIGMHTPSETFTTSFSLQEKMSGWAANLSAAKRLSPKPESSPSPTKSPAKISSPEAFNAAEILDCLSARYHRELAEAKQDKLGEKVRVYRSLHSSSAWTTKSSVNSRGRRDEDGRFNLLDEVNRAIARAKKH